MLSDEERERMLDSVVKYVVDSKKTLSVIECDRFLDFCQALNPDFSVPSCRIFVKAIQDKYLVMQERFRSTVLIIPGKIAITSDAWY